MPGIRDRDHADAPASPHVPAPVAYEGLIWALNNLPYRDWSAIRAAVEGQFMHRASEARKAAVAAAAASLEMTAEGYVREWVRQGSQNPTPLPPWEQAYQDAGFIEQAAGLGYIEIGRGPAAEVSLLPRGMLGYSDYRVEPGKSVDLIPASI